MHSLRVLWLVAVVSFCCSRVTPLDFIASEAESIDCQTNTDGRECRCRRIVVSNGTVVHQIRCLPSFIIAGTQKSGTTALAGFLSGHASIAMSVVKEVHHFDRNRAYVKGLDHYLEAFPWIEYNPSDTTAAFTVPLFGEATPFYLASKYSCQRISVDMPKTKMIVLLREPISRAYSEYQMKLRRVEQQDVFLRLLKEHSPRLLDCFMNSSSWTSSFDVFISDLASCLPKLAAHLAWDKLAKGLQRVFTKAASPLEEALGCFFSHATTVRPDNSSLIEDTLDADWLLTIPGSVSSTSSMHRPSSSHRPELQFNASCFPRLVSEHIPSLHEALVNELTAFQECSGGGLPDDVDRFTRAVKRCVNVKHGISTQYVYRSMYAPQLHSCWKSLPREQFLVLPAEQLQRRPAEALKRVCAFLGVPVMDSLAGASVEGLISAAFPRFESSSGWRLQSTYSDIPSGVVEAIRPFFSAHNDVLASYLGTDEFSSRWSE